MLGDGIVGRLVEMAIMPCAAVANHLEVDVYLAKKDDAVGDQRSRCSRAGRQAAWPLVAVGGPPLLGGYALGLPEYVREIRRVAVAQLVGYFGECESGGRHHALRLV